MLINHKYINKGRQREIDLAKGISLIFLILCHVGLYLGDNSYRGLYVFSDIIGSELVAPIFMSCMGICLLYTKHNEPKDLLKRGIKIFVCGYLLSFIRTIIPYLILGPIDEWATLPYFFIVDIFQFSGLSLILISIFKKIKLPSSIIFLISLVMVGIAQIFMSNPLSIKSEQLSYFINLFLPVNDLSCFPLFIWFFFPAFGLFFGELLLHCKNKKKLYTILLPISLIVVLYVYYTFYNLYPDYTNYYYGNNYYYMGIKNVLLTSFFTTLALSIWYFLEKILPDFIINYLEFLGKNITIFYLISWITISMTIHFSAYYNIIYNVPLTIFMMIIQLVICSILTKAVSMCIINLKTKKK